MLQGYKSLVGFGSAPYQRDEKNGLSYFAEVEDANGVKETLWGVDLERSLQEAGAEIGDDVLLTRGDKKLVKVLEKQKNGTMIGIEVERVTWNTSIQLDEIEVTQGIRQHDKQPVADIASQSNATTAAIEGVEQDTQFAVMAPYWLDGLHNSQGITLAEEVNLEIKKNKLAEDKEAIANLLKLYPNAKRFGLEVVSRNRYLDDPHHKTNAAEPRSLLDGAFVRDKDGEYRPAAGGRAVLADKGDSLVLKSKSAEGYRAAMELAIAKGWTAIELKGKPAMLAEAWIEAKLKGLDVVNYSPTKEDLAKYTKRLAEERALSSSTHSQPVEQDPEKVELRPFVDAEGHNKVAQVTYTVSHAGGEDVDYGNPKDAARAFSAISDAVFPAVVRSVVRADGIVSGDIIAVADFVPGSTSSKMAKYVMGVLDQEFNEAFTEFNVEEKVQESLKPDVVAVSAGNYSGKILAIESGQVVQKIGRSPDDVVRHDVSKLSNLPKVGEVEDIHYANGKGVVQGWEQGREHGHELRR